MSVMNINKNNNPFLSRRTGGEEQTLAAKIAFFAYENFIKKKIPFSNEDVFKACFPELLNEKMSQTKEYKTLKVVVRHLCNIINDKAKTTVIIEKGATKGKTWQYIGENPDPLSDLASIKLEANLEKYMKFCEDTDGLLPISWIEHYFCDTRVWFNAKNKRKNGTRLIFADVDRIAGNKELVPILYEYIKEQRAVSFTYNSNYNEKEELVFHPHILREHNGGWHLFGYGYPERPDSPRCRDIAIDRIEKSTLRALSKSECHYEPIEDKDYYTNKFKYRIGVSEDYKAGVILENVIVGVHSEYMFNLLNSKPLHQHQWIHKTWKPCPTGGYGEFLLRVEINNEFIGRILHLGDSIEIISPESVRQRFSERIARMYEMYTRK